MSNLISFNFQNSLVRIIDRDNNPWFIANDVCDILEIQNVTQALQSLDDDEKAKLNTTSSPMLNIDLDNRVKEINIINESGLYVLILRSRKAVQKGTVQHKFRKWVTAEVLPSIRKTGHYRHTITPAQQQAIRVAVAKVCKNHRTHYQTVYETLKSHFEIPRYSELLACDFEEAMALISNFSPNVTTNNSLRYNAQCLAWHAYVIHSWYKAIEPHFRALSPQLCGEIHDHISHAKIFAIGINHQIGLGQMTPMLPHLETKRWAIAY